jgi:hypothetical protein
MKATDATIFILLLVVSLAVALFIVWDVPSSLDPAIWFEAQHVEAPIPIVGYE